MSWKLTCLAAVAIVAIAGAAVAATSATNNVTLCAAKSDGALSLASKERCARGEKKLTIAKQGPPGPRGAVGQQGPRGAVGGQGPAGAAGASGTTASVQPEPVQLIGPASPPASHCEESPGVFCDAGNFEWANGGGEDAPVGFQRDAAGYVHLQGTAQVIGSGGGEPPEFVFLLPAGYRPLAGDLSFAVPSCGNEFTAVGVRTDGAVIAPVGVGCLVHFDGIAFHP
jgi:hypothetical protein